MFFNVKGYFRRNSSNVCPKPVFLHSPWQFNLFAVNLAAPMTARYYGGKHRATSSAFVGIGFTYSVCTMQFTSPRAMVRQLHSSEPWNYAGDSHGLSTVFFLLMKLVNTNR
jgi:hypothetical protein